MELLLNLSTYVPQVITIIILGIGLILFVKDHFRYDVVALLIILLVIFTNTLPAEEALANFGHPAVIVVASMFVITAAFSRSGIIEIIVARLSFLYRRPVLSLAFMMVFVAIISAFINNVGALAVMLPIALHLAHKTQTPIAFFLLPLAFASHLGGYLTLIGTPRNILISEFRADATGEPFAMFDFALVGAYVAVAGLTFLIIYAYFFLPRNKQASLDTEATHHRTYTTEVLVTADTKKITNQTVHDLIEATGHNIRVMAIRRQNAAITYHGDTVILMDDTLLLQGKEDILAQYVEAFKFTLTGIRAHEQYVSNHDDQISVEVLVPPYAKIAGLSWNEIPLRDRFGINFIGLSRVVFAPNTTLADAKIIGNDLLLLQGRRDSVLSTIASLGLISLANTGATMGRPLKIVATIGLIVAAVAIASLNIVSLPVVFMTTVILLLIFNLMSVQTVYDSIDWPVLVLLAGMITLGDAITASGTDASLSNFILLTSEFLPAVAILALTLFVSMVMSDFINTTAAAVVMGPVAILVATSIGASVDPFLMAVAIGASSAFLTPVGHESNALVMQRGGYRFSDFMRIGLPLELIILVISVPLILIFWPLY